jgi:hypothetical protein
MVPATAWIVRRAASIRGVTRRISRRARFIGPHGMSVWTDAGSVAPDANAIVRRAHSISAGADRMRARANSVFSTDIAA